MSFKEIINTIRNATSKESVGIYVILILFAIIWNVLYFGTETTKKTFDLQLVIVVDVLLFIFMLGIGVSDVLWYKNTKKPTAQKSNI